MVMDFKLSKYVEFVPTHGTAKSQLIYSLRTAKSCWLPIGIAKAIKDNAFDLLSEKDLDFLKEIEVLVPASENELKAVLYANNEAVSSSRVLSLSVQPTAQCQLGCDYCGQKHDKKKMTSLVRNGLLERVRMRLCAKSYQVLHITWFGAEPLLGMSEIRYLTPKLIELSTEFGCRYSSSIVTNGLSLKLRVFNELVGLGVTKFEVTLDGVAASHDLRRPTKSGEKTFDIIFRNILNAVNSPRYGSEKINMSIRCNVDKDNYSEVDALIDLLAENDLQNKVQLYFAPIHSWGNDAHLNALETAKFAEQEVKWIAKLYAKGFYRSCLVPRKRKEIVCMAVSKDGEVVDAYGNVFNCTEFPYVPTYDANEVMLGNVQFNPLDTFSDKRLFSDWNEDVENGYFPCATCKLLPICGGACPKSWYEGNPACPSLKENLSQRLKIDALALSKINAEAEREDEASQRQKASLQF